MTRKVLITSVVILALLLAGLIGFVVFMEQAPQETPPESTAAPTTAPTEATTVPTTAVPTTQVPETTLSPETTLPPTEATTVPTEPTTEPVETEPQPETFLLTFVGDCTLGSTNENYGVKHSFIDTIGENYDYPFASVKQYFEADDFTFANLECVISDERMYSSAQFSFRGPTAYTQILTGASVEAVTLANNHTGDFGEKGLTHTKEALDGAGITWVEKNGSAMFTTESGLTIGMYGVNFVLDEKDMEKQIKSMRKQGAEIIIVAFHWGSEGVYRPNSGQVNYAHAAIDAGADIVYGSHPHVLQKVENYGDGIIYYSLGNFSFGGNNWPPDLDSAVLQQEVIRDLDGSVRLGKLTMIPCSVSSLEKQNDFQPTPYEPGSKEYDRVISKLDGSFKGPNLYVKYEEETVPTTAPAETAPAESAPVETAPAEVPDTQPATQPPVEDTFPVTPDVPDIDDPQP